MSNSFKYPIYVIERNSNWFLWAIENEENLMTIEEIDILDEEYIGWDSDGKQIKLELIDGVNTVVVTSNELFEDELKNELINHANKRWKKYPFKPSRENLTIEELLKEYRNHSNKMNWIKKFLNWLNT